MNATCERKPAFEPVPRAYMFEGGRFNQPSYRHGTRMKCTVYTSRGAGGQRFPVLHNELLYMFWLTTSPCWTAKQVGRQCFSREVLSSSSGMGGLPLPMIFSECTLDGGSLLSSG